MEKILMKKLTRNTTLIVALASALGISACSNGTTESQPAQQNTAPLGPVSYTKIHAMFHPESFTVSTNNVSVKISDPTDPCGQIMSDAGTGLSAASGFVNLIPVVGPILGAIFGATGSVLSLEGANQAATCTSFAMFNMIESQLLVQQQEITNLTTNLNLSENNLWTSITTNALDLAYLSYNDFNNYTTKISGTDGAFIDILSSAGLYDNFTEQPSQFTLSQLESSAAQLQTLNTALTTYQGNDPLSLLKNIAGFSFANTPGSSYPDAYSQVRVGSDTYYINSLKNTNADLPLLIANGLKNGENVIQLFDQYNNTLVAYYQQSVNAIQNAYTIAYLINYLNYFNTQNVTLPDVYNVHGTYYSSANASNISYNTAQENVTKFYAALMNQAYVNAVGYIVTDKPVAGQSYPDNQLIPFVNSNGYIIHGVESVNYSAIVGSALAVESATATEVIYKAFSNLNASTRTEYNALASSLSLLTSSNPPNSPSNSGILFYQYGGINNVATCLSTIESYNSTNSTNINKAFSSSSTCPSVLSNKSGTWNNQAIVESNTLVPYFYNNNQTSYPVLTGSVTNNINPSVCNSNAVGNVPAWNMYIYVPYAQGGFKTLGTQGTPYLLCGNWQTTGLANNSQPSQYVLNSLGENVAYFSTLQSMGNSDASTSFYFTNDAPNNYANYTVMAVDDTNYWSGYTAGNTVQNVTVGASSSFHQLVAGTSQSSIAAVQYKFPDGFISSFGLAVTVTPGFSATVNAGYSNAYTVYNYNGIYVGLSINPNMLLATINGKSIVDTSDIDFSASGPQGPGGTIYTSPNNLSWWPVISNDPYLNTLFCNPYNSGNIYDMKLSSIKLNNNRVLVYGGGANMQTSAFQNEHMYVGFNPDENIPISEYWCDSYGSTNPAVGVVTGMYPSGW